MHKNVSLCLLAALLQPLAPAASQTPGVALELAPSNVIGAPRGSKFLMLLNLQQYRATLTSMSDADFEKTLAETAKAQVKRLIEAGSNKSNSKDFEVIFAFVTNMDEYNRPDFGGMARLGSAIVELNSRDPIIKSISVTKTAN